ncbi:MAG: hypothetical protein IJ907_00785 [Prevotella sp.]|nr:hypothetical protein [Prevotella sp.]
MSITNLFRNAVKNPFTTAIIVVVAIVMVYEIFGDIHDMRAATSGYDYCHNLCYLFDNICACYFMTIFFIMCYFTYINKQFSKWSIWLFYALGVSVLVKFFIAGLVFDYVYHHVESEYMNKIPSLARTIFLGGVYWITIVFFFVPKFIKDTMKLKEEQELTI